MLHAFDIRFCITVHIIYMLVITWWSIRLDVIEHDACKFWKIVRKIPPCYYLLILFIINYTAKQMSRLGEAPPWHVTGPVYIEDQPTRKKSCSIIMAFGLFFLFIQNSIFTMYMCNRWWTHVDVKPTSIHSWFRPTV